jgi:hypothetical protein
MGDTWGRMQWGHIPGGCYLGTHALQGGYVGLIGVSLQTRLCGDVCNAGWSREVDRCEIAKKALMHSPSYRALASWRAQPAVRVGLAISL